MINSPGGSVAAGSIFIQAMDIAKARGVRFKCVVTSIAASMATHIYGNCNDRYAFASSFILWHEAYQQFGFGATMTEQEMRDTAEQLRLLTGRLEYRLQKALRLTDKQYEYYHKTEMLIPALALKSLTPNFLTIIHDIDGDFEL